MRLRKMNKIWGLTYESIYADGHLFWKTEIKNPFRQGDYWKIGIGSKFLWKARQEGVEKFILKVGEREIMMFPPSKKVLDKKVKQGEYEDKPSLFKDSAPMRIFFFNII